MVARLHFMYVQTPVTMAIIALIGGLTAVYAATIALTQRDIKKVLAYSTVSQLGFMFLAIGSGAFATAIFHLMTHAFFKACLFLCAGAVIHALHGQQDGFKMGGLKKYLPVTCFAFLASTLAIGGFPLLSGFFSKDEVLWSAMSLQYTDSYLAMVNAPGLQVLHEIAFICGMIAAFCTAFYMMRLYCLIFLGTYRGDTNDLDDLHLPSRLMRFALLVLAFLAIFGGSIGMPFDPEWNLFGAWLEPVFAMSSDAFEHTYTHSSEYALMAVSVAIALAGFALGWAMYRKGPGTAGRQMSERMGTFFKWSYGAYFVDTFVERWIKRPFGWFATLCHSFVDRFIIDGMLVHGSARIASFAGEVFRHVQTGNVQHYVLAAAAGLAALLSIAFL
jgi:NADH-quinone oxidoreductase subunit L